MTPATATELVISPAQFLEHWQGHRALTRRVIEAFPDDKLFTHSIGGMRTFSSFAMEFLGMAVQQVAEARVKPRAMEEPQVFESGLEIK